VSDRPVLRVVSGDATPEEIAAVVAAVAASSAPEAEGRVEGRAGAGTTSAWAAPAHAHRHIRATFTASPDGWRTSFWPR
jgi:hypothetical protein